jgi:PAS domain-containing protein
MDDCVVFTNLEGKIQYINESCCKKLVYSRAEMQEKVLSDFQYPGDPFAIGPLRFFEDTKGVWTGVLSMKNKYGMKVRTSLKSTPVVKDNWVIGRIFVLREIL